MERKFLEGMGLEKKQINEILNANSADIGRAKSDLQAIIKERDNLQEQLGTVQERFKEFDGINVGELTEEIKKLKEDLAVKDADYQKKIAEKDFTVTLSETIAAAKGRNAKAITANLDIDILKSGNNQKENIKAAIEALKESDPYLFESEKKEPQIITGGALGGNRVFLFF